MIPPIISPHHARHPAAFKRAFIKVGQKSARYRLCNVRPRVVVFFPPLFWAAAAQKCRPGLIAVVYFRFCARDCFIQAVRLASGMFIVIPLHLKLIS